MDNKEKLYFEIENSEEFINSKSEDEYDKKVSNYENLLKIRKSVIPIGTMIGAFYGLIMILLEYYFLPFDSEFIRYLIISILIIPVIYTTVVINKKNSLH